MTEIKNKDSDLQVNHELTGAEYEYPYEYFDAQVQFAFKWAELSGDSIESALLNRTALYRRITDGKPLRGELSPIWSNLMAAHDKDLDASVYAQLVFETYKAQPFAVYQAPSYSDNDGKHFGFFSFDYMPNNPTCEGKNTVKVHFLNSKRGEMSGLHPDFMDQRQSDLARMMRYIHTAYPDAEEVIGGSWLYNIPQYKETFPQEFTQGMKQMVPPGFEHMPNTVGNMSFGGNSVWGQFVNRFGGAREPAYTNFIYALGKANSLEELLNAFPDKPMQPRASIDIFYSHFKINN